MWVESAPGIRDLRFRTDGPGTVTWLEDGAPTEFEDVPVPAHRVWPGATWTALAELDDGRLGEAVHVVPEPPGGNVLVLLIDDVGVDKIGAYGTPWAAPTPRIDALAATGVRFTRAWASPVCSPSRGTLLTGRFPRRTGLGWLVDSGSDDHVLPLEVTTVPEALWQARSSSSWSNGAIGKWHLAGPDAPDWLVHPNRSGFDWFVGPTGNPPYGGRGYHDWDRNQNGVLSTSTTYLTTATVDDALDRVAQMPEPWFLYVAFNAAHTPLNDPPAHLLSGDVPGQDAPAEDRYDAVLEALDTEIGRLLDALGPDRLARTTVMLAGDNGTSDFGVPEEVDEGRNKHTVYERGIRVPLIVTGPHVRAPGVSDALVHLADVLPTVADLAGVPLTGDAGERLDLPDGEVLLDGRSLLPFLADPTASGRTWLYTEAHSNGPGPYGIDRRAIRDATHKLVFNQEKVELYRLEGDEALDVTDLITNPSLLTADDQVAWGRLQEAHDVLLEGLVFEGR